MYPEQERNIHPTTLEFREVVSVNSKGVQPGVMLMSILPPQPQDTTAEKAMESLAEQITGNAVPIMESEQDETDVPEVESESTESQDETSSEQETEQEDTVSEQVEESPQWSGEAALWAEELGLTPDQMKAFPDQEAFSTAAEHLYKTVARQHQQKAPERPSNGDLPLQKPQQDIQPAPVPVVPDVNYDDFDEPTANAFRAMHATTQSQAKKIEQLVGILSDLNQSVQIQGQADAETQLARELDKTFAGIGNEKIFGRGGLLAGGLSDVERQRRISVAHVVRAERDALESRGDVLPPERIHYHITAKKMFDNIADSVLQQAAKQSEEVDSHATPSGDASDRRKGPEKLTDEQVIDQWLERHPV